MMSLGEVTLSLVRAALAEDIGPGDLTSLATLEPGRIKARIIAKSEGIISGLQPAMIAFRLVDSAIEVNLLKSDGDKFETGDIIAEIEGFNQPVLIAERTALNFLARLSGIASLTGLFVEKANGRASIIDTRKTTPGWRLLEKAAVVHGGGVNHRMGLYDMVLIKDNHIAACGSITDAVRRTREFLDTPEFFNQFRLLPGDVVIEVEVTSEAEVREAVACGAHRLLLDNQTVASLTELSTLARRLESKIKIEASGNVTLANIEAISGSGVDYISSGSLTHSAPASDFSLRVIK